MKEDRNCGMQPFMYTGAMPIMPSPMPINQMPSMNYNTVQNQISSLEQRVSNLENMLNNSSYSTTSYNSTNYQMM